jgi:hypothetical protein
MQTKSMGCAGGRERGGRPQPLSHLAERQPAPHHQTNALSNVSRSHQLGRASPGDPAHFCNTQPLTNAGTRKVGSPDILNKSPPRRANGRGHGPGVITSMSTPQRNDARVISVGPDHRELLRVQSLAVLSFNHEGFEDIIDAEPAEAIGLATIYRDAFTVLDAVGWTAATSNDPKDVPLTAGHVTQLRRLRSDLALAVVDHMASGDAASASTAMATRQQLSTIEGLGGVLATYRRLVEA